MASRAQLSRGGTKAFGCFLVVFFLVFAFATVVRIIAPPPYAIIDREELFQRLRKVVVAAHKEFDARPTNPQAAPAFDESKLSWRVKLLPFLGQRKLFEEFRLDEPWDSAHNFDLISRMPEVFDSPGVEVTPGMTCFVRPIEVMDSFNPLPDYRAFDFSKHGYLVEVPPELAVPWTKPDDLSISDPRIKPFRRGLAIAVLDSTPEYLRPEDATPEKLKALFTPPVDASNERTAQENN